MGKRIIRTCTSSALVVLTLLLGSAGLAPNALADAGPHFSLKVGAHVVHSGEQVVVTGTATTTCTWLFEWNGERKAGRDVATYTATFTAPRVSRPTPMPVQGTCFYAGTGTNLANGASMQRPTRVQRGTLVAEIPPSWRHTVVVTVLPPGATVTPPSAGGGPGQPGGGLPGTGGPALGLLLAALGALILGVGVVRASTRQVAV